MTSFPTNTLINVETKSRTRRSREMDLRSNDNNMDMMLGGNNSSSIERKLEIVINHSLCQGDTEAILTFKTSHSKLRLETLGVELRPLGQIDT